jgi:hypothetical protein
MGRFRQITLGRMLAIVVMIALVLALALALIVQAIR